MKEIFEKLRNIGSEAFPEDSRLIVIFFSLLLFVFFSYTLISNLTGSSEDVKSLLNKEAAIEDDCNVYNLSLHGFLDTYTSLRSPEKDTTASEDIVWSIQEANKDDAIQAIVLEIDSGGGMPVAGEEVANALKTSSKPTVALIRSGGDSAAYMAATGAEIIFASKFSDVGSIGVTISNTDQSVKNERDGITFNQLSVGKYKDMFDSNKPITAEEKALIFRDLNIIQEGFIKMVAENRGLSVEKVRALADGSSMLGEMALEKGLVDKIGGIDEVNKYLEDLIGEPPKFCW
jgi:protease-4